MDKALDTTDLTAARTLAPLAFRNDINGLRALAVLGGVLAAVMIESNPPVSEVERIDSERLAFEPAA